MLGSWFSQLTVTSAVLAAVALAGVLRAGGHAAHRADDGVLAKRLRVVEAATFMGLGALALSALVGAAPVSAVTIAVVLGVSVLGWAPRRRSWTPAAIAAWAAGTTGAASWLGWLVERAVSSGSLAESLLLAALGPLAFWGLVSLREPASSWLASRAGDEGRTSGTVPARRTLLAVGAAVVVPALVAAAVVGTGRSSTTPTSPVGSTRGAETPRPDEDASAGGGDVTGAGSEAGAGSTAPSPSDTASGPASQTPTAAPSHVAGDATSPGPTAVTPSPTGTAGATASPTTDATAATKTPGYEKDNPNRPPDAPSPGGGRPGS